MRWVEKPGDEDQYLYVHSQEKTIWDIYNTIREIEAAFYAKYIVMQSRSKNPIVDQQVVIRLYTTTFHNNILCKALHNSFRVLKTDLSLRPIFHKKDQAVEAHLFLGILAYTLVNTIRFRLKASNIDHDWQNIVRMMNTQKAGTVSMNNRKGQRINIRLCSQPTVGANQIIKAMNYKLMPFHRKKFVFPES